MYKALKADKKKFKFPGIGYYLLDVKLMCNMTRKHEKIAMTKRIVQGNVCWNQDIEKKVFNYGNQNDICRKFGTNKNTFYYRMFVKHTCIIMSSQ